jgi:ubiquitin carboxyl-terminal hydrolase 36/42
MNDESVSSVSHPPLNRKSAYMLFYLRDKGQGLEAAVKPKLNGLNLREQPVRTRLSEGMKGMKRKERDAEMEDGEDKGEKVDKPLIGPLMPSPTINGDSKKFRNVDPQAASLKAKIQAAAKARTTMKGLSQYNSDDEDSGDDSGKNAAQEGEDNDDDKENGSSSPSKDVDMRPSSPPPGPPPTSSPSSPAKEGNNNSSSSGIPPSSFYGPNPTLKKRKSMDRPDRGDQKRPNPSSNKGKVQFSNPYSSVVTYSNKGKRRPRPRGL